MLAAQQALLRALGSINGQLAVDEKHVISDGKEVCLQIEQGETAAQMEKNAAPGSRSMRRPRRESLRRPRAISARRNSVLFPSFSPQ